ncbi:MAG: hypothetical protein ABIO24_09290, partial [Saprospiraceae bacterium]
MKNSLLFVCLLLLTTLNAQEEGPQLLPSSQPANYFDICAQLDAYFETEYVAAESPCWDDEYVKYQRWKWLWRDRVFADGSFPDLRAQWLDHRKYVLNAAQNRDNQPLWQNEGPTQNPNGGYWGMGR